MTLESANLQYHVPSKVRWVDGHVFIHHCKKKHLAAPITPDSLKQNRVLTMLIHGNPLIKTQEDLDNYIILFDIVDNHRQAFFNILGKRPEWKWLLEWIDSKVPKLLNQSNFIPDLGTKCSWIIHGWVDFPKCPVCGHPINDKSNCGLYGYRQHCGNSCKTKDPVVQAKIIKTVKKIDPSATWPSNTKIAKQHTKETWMDLYGVDNPMKCEAIKQKAKDRTAELHGDPNYRNSQQRIETCHRFYGQGTNGKKVSEARLAFPESKWIEIDKKTKQTKLKNHGDPNWNNTTKRIATNKDRYGVDHACTAPSVKQKTKETFLSNYGYDHNWKVPEIKEKMQRTRTSRYFYAGMMFDSQDEIAFYIWCLDHNIEIEAHPQPIPFYVPELNRMSRYFPDFKIGEAQLIEIKGIHMFKDRDPSKELIVPWKKPHKGSKQTYEEAMILAKRKSECIRANNVQIITSVDCAKYRSYVSSKYGKNFLKECRYHKPVKDAQFTKTEE